jgi:hypothetical protein
MAHLVFLPSCRFCLLGAAGPLNQGLSSKGHRNPIVGSRQTGTLALDAACCCTVRMWAGVEEKKIGSLDSEARAQSLFIIYR